MHPHSIKALSLLLSTLLTSGCVTDKEHLLPHGPQTMVDIWDGNTQQMASHRVDRPLQQARSQLRRPAAEAVDDPLSYARTAQNEIYSQFKRLPNPDLVLYVFPHLAGSDPVPVPGYSTVFPFYQRVQYALPGERTEDF